MTKPSYHISLFQIIYRAIAIPTLISRFYREGHCKMPKYKGPDLRIDLVSSETFDIEKLKIFFEKLTHDIYDESKLLVCINYMPIQYIQKNTKHSDFASRENLPLRGVIAFNSAVANDVYSSEIDVALRNVNNLFLPTVGMAKLAVLPKSILCPLNTYIYNINYVNNPFSDAEECNCKVVIQNSFIEYESMSATLAKVIDDKSEFITNLVSILDVDVNDTDKSIYLSATYNIDESTESKKVKFTLKFKNNETDELIEFISFIVDARDYTTEMIHKMANSMGFQLAEEKEATAVFELSKPLSSAEVKRFKKMSELDKIMEEITIAPTSEPEEEDESDEYESGDEPEYESDGELVSGTTLEEFLDEKSGTKHKPNEEVAMPHAPVISSEESIKKLVETFPEAGEW